MKYCPNCGAKLNANDKFCDHCGTDVSNVRPAGVVQKVQPVQQPSKKLDKNSKIRRNCLIVAACVVLLAAGGVVFFTLQSENMAGNLPFTTHKTATDKAAESIGYSPNKKMSSNDIAGFTIAYAHMNFKDDPDWDEVFDKARNGDLNIASYPEYNFGDYDVKAPEGGAVYVVTPEIGYVVSDVSHPQTAKVTYIDSKKGAEQPVYFHALAKKVAVSPHKNEVQTLGKKVVMSEQQSKPKQSTQSSTDQSKKDDDKLSWDDDKEEKLSDFMSDFGDKMDQDYDEYTGDDSLETHTGQKYPDIFDDADFERSDDDDQEIDIGWDPDMKKDYDYHVVSIFNYNGNSAEEHITYLFCIHDNQPVALVDQTTNGDAVKVKETENKDVQKAFANIVNDNDADSDDD